MGTCSTASRCELCPNRAIYWLAFTQLLQRRSPPRPRDLGRGNEGALGKRGFTRVPSYYGIIGYNRGALRTLADVLGVLETPVAAETRGSVRVLRCHKCPRARQFS